ncbi:Cystatin-11 [Microtus ochrogaster]|uniref:Cystatin-11 n=1 Tax=Microtus ochrogaster TaxID=79684 RepID=A0A8J6G6N3_MICOH|nr:Cystatin-11 [Microtus ochrogaster]
MQGEGRKHDDKEKKLKDDGQTLEGATAPVGHPGGPGGLQLPTKEEDIYKCPQNEYAGDSSAESTLKYVTEEYNKKSDDLYNFRIIRILDIESQVTDHMELHITVEMQRTTCFKTEKSTCDVQEGELYKQIRCYFSVYTMPWLERYKILRKKTAAVPECLGAQVVSTKLWGHPAINSNPPLTQ